MKRFPQRLAKEKVKEVTLNLEARSTDTDKLISRCLLSLRGLCGSGELRLPDAIFLQDIATALRETAGGRVAAR